MRARFEKYTGSEGRFYFRVITAAGNIILQSEGYSSAQARDEGIANIKASSGYARRYICNQTIRGTWFFNMVSAKGDIIGTSCHYETNAEMEAGINELRSLVTDAEITES